MKSHLVKINLNGVEREGLCESRTTLLDFIRHDLGATGTHAGCEHGVCGACTVEVDQQIIRSCLMFACQAEGATIKTVEGIANNESLSDLQIAFRKHHALQCGFCTPGFVMRALAMVHEDVPATPSAVREALSGNLCRCTGYEGIVKAICEGLEKLRHVDG